ncbi:MAG TPA: amino acid permease [Bacillota bacterium]|jgi:amino acid transporter|nr:amino acid permease [Bacillota bacterium]
MGDPQIKEVSLIRSMGFWQIWAIGVGAVVGDGIFLYMGQGVSAAGPSALLAFAIAGFLQMFIMVAMGELSVGMPEAGAMSVWVERYMGKFFGLLSGLTFSVGWVVLGGSISVALGRFMAYWIPIGSLDTGTVIWAAVWFSIFCIMNIAGAAIAGISQLILVLMLVGIMVIFAVAGIIKGVDMSQMTPFFPNGVGGFSACIPIATFAYMGAACICTSGSECKNPRDLGRALVWSSLTFIIVYCLALFVVLGTIDWKSASLDVSIFTVAAETIWGPIGGTILNFAAWLAAATCLIMGTIYTPSRIFYSMAKEGYMPKVLARVNPKTKTPITGIVIIWIIGILGILAAMAFGAATFYVTLCNQAVIAWSISWGLAVIAGIYYRKDLGIERIKNEVGWHQPLYPAIPILAIIGILYVLYLCFYDMAQVVGFVIWMGIYIIYYLRIKSKINKGLIRADVQF